MTGDGDLPPPRAAVRDENHDGNRMTPDRLRECLAALRWSQRCLAGAIAVDEGTVRKWARGAGTVPPAIAAWLERRAEAMLADPPPPAPDRRRKEV